MGAAICPSIVARFYRVAHTMNNRTVLLKGRRRIGTIVHQACPRTAHVTSSLSRIAYTAFGPSRLSHTRSLSNASMTMMTKRLNITRGTTM